MNAQTPTVYLVVPCYNEEEVLPETSTQLRAKMQGLIDVGAIAGASRILFVDDGSRDKTWEIIARLHDENPLFSGVKLSRNRGHQNALLCGLMTAAERCDCTISLDADLQDDVDAIDRFIDEYKAGADVVYGVRSSRKTDSFFKKFTAEGFYKIMAMLGVDIVFNHADYRLLSRRAVEALRDYKEVNLFLRGIVPLIGYKSAQVTYERHERFAGESKYPLKKMLAFAWDGVTSFSLKPLKMITSCGVILAVLSALLWLGVFLFMDPFGRAMGLYWLQFATTFFVGALVLIAVGIVAQYIGKMYMEVKERPRFFVDEVLDS